jgi:hypothetical protein
MVCGRAVVGRQALATGEARAPPQIAKAKEVSAPIPLGNDERS